MKNKFIKIISSLLIVTLLFSAFTVLSYAETGTTEDAPDGTALLYNRNFEEGWDVNNGLHIASGAKSHNFHIGNEQNDDLSYNYFMRCEAGAVKTEGYVEFTYTPQPATGGSVFSFDIKTDDYTDMDGRCMYMRTVGGAKNGSTLYIMDIVNNTLRLPSVGSISGSGNTPTNAITTLNDGEWIRVVICYDCGAEGSTEDKIAFRIYVGYADSFDQANAVQLTANCTDGKALYDSTTGARRTIYYDSTLTIKTAGGSHGLDIVRIQIPGAKNGNIDYSKGQSYCIDNLNVYNGEVNKILTAEQRAKLDNDGYGTRINKFLTKTIDIITEGGGKSTYQKVNEALLMKVGVNYGLYSNTRRAIVSTDMDLSDGDGGIAYGAPFKKDGKVFVPLQALLDHIGYPYYDHGDGYSWDFATADSKALIAVGRDTAIMNGEVVNLTAAPVAVVSKLDSTGNKLVPLETGDETNSAIAKYSYIAVAMDDVEKLISGYHITYDEMGLIVFSEYADVVNREHDLELMVNKMAEFIYDYKDGNWYETAVRENTNGFKHPYLLADQKQFDFLNDIYTNPDKDPELKEMLDELLESAAPSDKTVMESSLANVGGTYYAYKYGWNAWMKEGVTPDTKKADVAGGTYLTGTLTKGEGVDAGGNPYYLNGAVANPHKNTEQDANNGGYDWDGGRLDEAAYYAKQARLYALCYQITRKEAFAHAAYEILLALSDSAKWAHWGHGHFLNAADATAAFAMAYDWLYTDWTTTLGYSVSDMGKLEDAIYRNGLKRGGEVAGMNGNPFCDMTVGVRRQGQAIEYATRDNNWNAVCTSGMVIGSLAVLGSSNLGTTEKNTAKWLLENNTETLAKNGLIMYAPDGSYIESPAYWVYSTNSLVAMIWALETAVGDDMGFLDMWGMDKTFYFACQVEFSSSISTETNSPTDAGYQYWNYHDSSVGYMDTSTFFYAADALGQKSLIPIRLNQLKSKPIALYDILGYREGYSSMDLSGALDELELTYLFESCDGIVSRSSFDDGSLFVGIMGGSNNLAHGQIDSGNFIYANKDYVWFCDLGKENYNVKDYFTANSKYRYRYFRMNAEGNNVVCLVKDGNEVNEMIYGQDQAGSGVLMEYEYNEYGMKAIVDNSSVYGDYCNVAIRGVLLTNNKSTVVIQDQITFSTMSQVVWVGQTAAAIKLSDDKKTAWLIKEVNGKEEAIRCTLLSGDDRLEFSIRSSSEEADYLLTNTMKRGESEGLGGVAEYNRGLYQRLVIVGPESLSFECAVVVEDVESQFVTAEDKPVEYKYTTIGDWEISKEYTGGIIDPDKITTPDFGDIKLYGDIADALMKEGKAFSGEATIEFFRAMMKAEVCADIFDKLFVQAEALQTAYETFKVNKVKYEGYQAELNKQIKSTNSLAAALSGYRPTVKKAASEETK